MFAHDRAGRQAGKPVLIDPKGSDYSRYAGATVITPNRAELAQVVEAPGATGDLAPSCSISARAGTTGTAADPL